MRGGVHRYAAQASLRIDAATAQKGRFRMKTSLYKKGSACLKTAPVTVITAVYNAERFLRETVESVSKQQLLPVQHLLVDDCSTDGSLDLARELEKEFPLVRVVSLETNGGYPAALNAGLREAASEYVGILDSDDIAMPHWLASVVPVLDGNPDIGSAGGGGVIMTHDGLVTGHAKYCSQAGDVTAEVMAGKYAILHPGSVHRRDFLLKTGGYNPRLRSAEDCDMFLNMASVARLVNVGEPLIYYRCLPGSESRKTPEFAALAEAYLAQKAQMLSAGKSLPATNAELASLVNALAALPRLAPLVKGAYEYEMAEALRRGDRRLCASRFYFASAISGHKRFLCCRRALRCLMPRLKSTSEPKKA